MPHNLYDPLNSPLVKDNAESNSKKLKVEYFLWDKTWAVQISPQRPQGAKCLYRDMGLDTHNTYSNNSHRPEAKSFIIDVQ